MNNKLILSCVVVALIFGAGGFYGGIQYDHSQAPNMRFGGGPGGQFQVFQRGQGGRGFNGAGGQVISKDDKSLTLQLMGGGSKIVYYSASTTVGKMATGTIADVTQGSNVMVMGTTNSDGSVTASMIQLRPDRPMEASSTR
jgi:hypothetical protein